MSPCETWFDKTYIISRVYLQIFNHFYLLDHHLKHVSVHQLFYGNKCMLLFIVFCFTLICSIFSCCFVANSGVFGGGQRGHLPWVPLLGGHKIVPSVKNIGLTIWHTKKKWHSDRPYKDIIRPDGKSMIRQFVFFLLFLR